MNHVVFVYGTLKRDFGNHRILARATFLGNGKTGQPFELVRLWGFPGMIRVRGDRTGTAVRGEVYAVDDRTLADLDHLESNGALYQRAQTPIILESGGTLTAWAYLYLGDTTTKPAIGDTWQHHVTDRERVQHHNSNGG